MQFLNLTVELRIRKPLNRSTRGAQDELLRHVRERLWKIMRFGVLCVALVFLSSVALHVRSSDEEAEVEVRSAVLEVSERQKLLSDCDTGITLQPLPRDSLTCSFVLSLPLLVFSPTSPCPDLWWMTFEQTPEGTMH